MKPTRLVPVILLRREAGCSDDSWPRLRTAARRRRPLPTTRPSAAATDYQAPRFRSLPRHRRRPPRRPRRRVVDQYLDHVGAGRRVGAAGEWSRRCCSSVSTPMAQSLIHLSSSASRRSIRDGWIRCPSGRVREPKCVRSRGTTWCCSSPTRARRHRSPPLLLVPVRPLHRADQPGGPQDRRRHRHRIDSGRTHGDLSGCRHQPRRRIRRAELLHQRRSRRISHRCRSDRYGDTPYSAARAVVSSGD